MKIKIISIIALIAANILFAQKSEPPCADDAQNNPFYGLKISGQWFIGYQTGKDKEEKYNEFLLKRGYLTIAKKFSDKLSGRITQDISVDREGDGEGDVELRLKYVYLQYKFGDFYLFTDATLKAGLAPRAWTDFEQSINAYRLQGPMFFERAGMLSSADYGILIESLIGGKVDENYMREIDPAYPGKFGSLALGIFNGGGYHAIEKNCNKILEGRLTLRPFYAVYPALQISGVGTYGKGNTEEAPVYDFKGAFISNENKRAVITAGYFISKGNEDGSAIDSAGKSVKIYGGSVFGELKIYEWGLSFIAQFDAIDNKRNANKLSYNRNIFGAAYTFLPGCRLLIDYERKKNKNNDDAPSYSLNATMELKF